jgi:hypothetical protein
MTFKNKAQLQKFLSEKCAKAVEKTEKKVYEELSGNLNQFYTEFKPEEYIRTGELFNALESTGVIRTGNQHVIRAEAEVGFNIPSYESGWISLQSGNYGHATWDGETVLEVAMTGSYGGLPHGGYADGTAIWTESMNKLGGKKGIQNLLKQELKK